MWEIFLSSSIIATVLGSVVSIVGIILTNNYSRNKERSEKRYILAKEIYQKLISVYTKNLSSETKEDESIGVIVTDAIITVFRDCVNKLEDMIGEAEKKHKQLYFSAMQNPV